MPELRWILILLGVLLIAAVYFIGRRRQQVPSQRFEPHLPDDADEERRGSVNGDEVDLLIDDSWQGTNVDEVEAFHDATEPTPIAREETPHEESPPEAGAQSDERKIIAVRVAARSSTRFRGVDIIRLLNEEGLEFGKYGIFHRDAGGSGSAPVFSVASMIEPGSFNLDAADIEHLPGVTLFMVLPGPQDGVAALDDMLGTAQRLAEQLNGEVLDQSGSTLSRQRASNLRDEIIGFQHHLVLQKRQTPAGKGRRRFL
ncbi:MAG: cell division protein ZipA [Gammaproteobacteria bacterium]|nr:cell division protein ZipA [Gammaproteobacteria bacterium]